MSAYSDAVIADLPGSGSYWQMTESSGSLADSGGGGNTLTASGGPAYQQAGPLAGGITPNYSILFANASATAFAGGTAVFEFLATASFSLECWINLSTQPGSGAEVFSKRNATVDGWDWSAYLPRGSRWLTNAADQIAITAYPLGTWVHDVLTYDGSNMRLYRNGSLLNGPTASTKSIISTAAAFTIGKISGGGSGMDGYLAQPAVYPGVVLSAAQILNHYTLGTTAPSSIPLPSWPRIRFNG